MINVDLLLKELKFLTINPEQHDQSVWVHAISAKYSEDPNRAENTACGTYGCLAGNTVIHSGEKLKWYFEPNERLTDFYDGRLSEEEIANLDGRWKAEETADGERIEKRARELFGLTTHQAERLFDAHNSRADLWDLAKQMTLGEIDEYHWRSAELERANRRVEQLEQRVLKLTEEEKAAYALSSELQKARNEAETAQQELWNL